MNTSETKHIHDRFQADVNIFMRERSNSMIDFMVNNMINQGVTDVESIAKALRLSSDKLLSAISTSLFKVENGIIVTQ